MFAEDQRLFMLFFSRFHVWHAREWADSSHGDKIPIGRNNVLTHAAVKTNVRLERVLASFGGDDKYSTRDGVG